MIVYTHTLTCPMCGTSESVRVTDEGTSEAPRHRPSKNFESFLAAWKLDNPSFVSPGLSQCIRCGSWAVNSWHLEVATQPLEITLSKSPREPRPSDLAPFHSRSELNNGLRKFERWLRSTLKSDEKFVDDFRVLNAQIDYGAQFEEIQREADILLNRARPEDRDYASRKIEKIMEHDSYEANGDDDIWGAP